MLTRAWKTFSPLQSMLAMHCSRFSWSSKAAFHAYSTGFMRPWGRSCTVDDSSPLFVGAAVTFPYRPVHGARHQANEVGHPPYALSGSRRVRRNSDESRAGREPVGRGGDVDASGGGGLAAALESADTPEKMTAEAEATASRGLRLEVLGQHDGGETREVMLGGGSRRRLARRDVGDGAEGCSGGIAQASREGRQRG